MHYLKIFFFRAFIQTVSEQETISFDRSPADRDSKKKSKQKICFCVFCFIAQRMPASPDRSDAQISTHLPLDGNIVLLLGHRLWSFAQRRGTQLIEKFSQRHQNRNCPSSNLFLLAFSNQNNLDIAIYGKCTQSIILCWKAVFGYPRQLSGSHCL